MIQGVSAWPTELLRVVAGVAAVVLLVYGHRSRIRACDKVEKEGRLKLEVQHPNLRGRVST